MDKEKEIWDALDHYYKEEDDETLDKLLKADYFDVGAIVNYMKEIFPEASQEAIMSVLGGENYDEFISSKDVIDHEVADENSYIESYYTWDKTEGKNKRISDYRTFAHLSKDDKITEENLDEQALNKTCFINYDYPKEKLVAELLDQLN